MKKRLLGVTLPVFMFLGLTVKNDEHSIGG